MPTHVKRGPIPVLTLHGEWITRPTGETVGCLFPKVTTREVDFLFERIEVLDPEDIEEAKRETQEVQDTYNSLRQELKGFHMELEAILDDYPQEERADKQFRKLLRAMDNEC